MTNPRYRSPTQIIEELDHIEKQITSSIQSAAAAVTELSRDKPSVKQVEAHTQSFLKHLEEIENGLSRDITDLFKMAASQPHEGSNYAAQKDLQMAGHRFEHVRSRLNELDRMRVEHTAQAQTSGGGASGQDDGQGQLQRALTSEQPHT